MWNARVVGLGRFPLRFQGRAWEAKHRTLLRAVHEVVRMKPKLQWRSQEVGQDRHVNHLSWEPTGNKWSQPKRGGMWGATNKVYFQKPYGTHILPLPVCTLDVRYGATEKLMFSLLRFGHPLVLLFSVSLFQSFGMGIFNPALLYLGVM